MSRSTYRVSSNTPAKELAYTNLLYLNPSDQILQIRGIQDGKVQLQMGKNYYRAEGHSGVEANRIALNKFQREDNGLSMNEQVQLHLHQISNKDVAFSMELNINFIGVRREVYEVQATELATRVKFVLANQVLSLGQSILIEYVNNNFIVTPSVVTDLSGNDIAKHGQITQSTQISFQTSQPQVLKIKGQRGMIQNNIFKERDFSFEKLGIGGLDHQFKQIFRRAFSSRVFPGDIIEKLGIKHVKGMLLFGPPGTGKTLIARQIGKMLNSHEPKVVNGPEVLSKFVGQSEENVRKLFAEAEEEEKSRGNDSSLHIIIFDEIDAICRSRGGSGDSTGVHDSIVNQLLTKVDGVNALNNILLIGMTNRKDLLDEALLRPGRLEVQVEVGLPDKQGRNQILKIHTNKMSESSFMDRSVDLAELADLTSNFSGAELEGLVKSAVSFALTRQVDIADIRKPIKEENIKVTMDDFRSALGEIKPAFGAETEALRNHVPHGIVNYGEHYQQLSKTLGALVQQIASSDTRLVSCLLRGPPGSGKTALAASVGLQAKFPFIKVVSAEQMVGQGESAKVAKISGLFENAYRTQQSLIILDDIERLLDYVAIGPRFSNSVLQSLLVLAKRNPPEGRKLLVIATSSLSQDMLIDLGITQAFNLTLEVPNLSKQDIQEVLIQTNSFGNNQLTEASAYLPTADIPIKRLFMLLNMARVDVPAGKQIPLDNWRSAMDDLGYHASYY